MAQVTSPMIHHPGGTEVLAPRVRSNSSQSATSAHSLTHSLTHSHSHSLTHSYSPSLSLSHSHSYSQSHSSHSPSSSPDPASLTIRAIQTPTFPHPGSAGSMHHPQPQSATSGSKPPTPFGVQMQMQASLPLESPRSLEPNGYSSNTPPPRPARAALRSSSNLGLPRSPSTPALSNESPASVLVARDLASSPSIPLIHKALENSKDGGETLDLSREHIHHISDDEVEFFRTRVGKHNTGVWRLALSYNALADGSISRSFNTLSRLRYLNLKGNQFTAIPPALCEMQGLEILDLSKNQITALPENPGRLSMLKVLSLSNNNITMLPVCLVSFNNLKVFKVDHNPVVWPPLEILGPLIDAEPMGRRTTPAESGDQKRRREEDLGPWIQGMKIWLQEQIADRQERQKALALQHADKLDKFDKLDKEYVFVTPATDATSEPAAPHVVSPPSRAVTGPSQPPARVPSPTKTHPLQKRDRAATISEESLILNTSTLSLPPQELRHDRSISSSSSLTPPISASSSSHSGPHSASAVVPPPPPPLPTQQQQQPPSVPGHNRGGSYTVPHRLGGNLTAKKSLPDLRKSHAKIIEERRNEGSSDVRNPFKPTLRKVSPPTASDKVRTLKTMASMEVLRPPKEGTVAMTTDLERRPTNPDAPTLDESRNSYFRRVSMLPASTISKAVSPAMLMFIDAVRGLLFALTHLHSALRQYVNFAVSDRVAGVFARVLEPAGGYLSNLINALDRFDSTSRRTAPPVTAVRGVVDAAKESIAVFGKIVAVLRFQTPAFRDADVRYTRQLLLSIYGGMAEIAQSWKTIAPLLVEIKPILHPEAARALGAPMSKSNSMSGRTPISPIPESGEAHSPERTRPLAASTSALTPGPASYAAAVAAPGQSPPNFTSPRGKNRRHAGSFSTEDVERGMMMGVPGQGQVHAHAHPPHTPRNDWPDLSRTIFEDNEAMADTAPPPFPLHAEPEPPNVTPPQVLQRDALPPIVTSFAAARGRHAAMSSSGSSLYAQSGAGGGVRSLSVDVRPPTPASATLFDEDLLDQIETTTDLAFNVWLRLSEDINAPLAAASAYAHGKSDSISSASGLDRTPLSAKQYSELVQNLSRAEQVTMTLRASLMGLRANPFAYAHASLPENAQTFIFQVVKLLNVIKALSPHRQFSTPTRQGLSQLTQATRECAILIQVSSLQPSSAASASASLSMSASASASASASISASASSASVVGGAGQDPGFGGYKPGFGPEPSASQVMLAHEAEADRERERVAENEADSHLHDGKPDFKPNFTLGAPRSAEDTGPGLRDLPPVRERAA